ncbi:MAG: hypothetical protein WCC12_04475, partial [Anaerolineales bacterium]
KAILDYTKAIGLNPREPRLYLARGKSYLANGEIDCAKADFHQVLVVADKAYLRRQAEDLLGTLKTEGGNRSAA